MDSIAKCLAVAVCVFTVAAHGQMGTRRPCVGSELLRVPLASSQEMFSARAPSDFVVKVSKFETGWAVSVFAPDDRDEKRDLLTPRGEWNGFYSVAFWILPEVSKPQLWLPNRNLRIGSTDQHLCLSVQKPRTASKPSGHFVSGSLIVYWRRVGA